MSNQIEAGSIVEGTVTKIKPFGAIVSLPGKVHGLVHISHISTSYVENINEHLSVGDTVTVKILTIDPQSGKISLSIKDASPTPSIPVEPAKPRNPKEANTQFEEKFKEFLKSSNERLAGLNKRNKRR